MTTIYMVWVQTDDYYDDGHVVAAHSTRESAEADAATWLSPAEEYAAAVTSAEVVEWELQ